MNRLKELRTEKGLTQQELADKIGVSKLTILRWEQGQRDIKSDKAQQLADYFGVSVGYLLGYSDYKSHNQIENLPISDDAEIAEDLYNLIAYWFRAYTGIDDVRIFLDYIDGKYKAERPDDTAVPLEIIQMDRERLFTGLINAPQEVQELNFCWPLLSEKERKSVLALIKSLGSVRVVEN